MTTLLLRLYPARRIGYHYVPVLLLAMLISPVLSAQCPVINTAIVNSCAPGASEGVNEFIVFTTTASAPASAYTFYYGSANPPAPSFSGRLAGSDAITRNGTGNLTSSNGCTRVDVTSPSTTIPANSTVIFIPSDFDQVYDITGLCTTGTVYVVYINRSGANSVWLAGGVMANNTSSTSRFLQVVNGANNCTSGIRSYNSSGWASNSDGNAVWWDAAGTATYVNNGCSVIAPPGPTVTVTPTTPVSACAGATSVNLPYTSTGSPDRYSITWSAVAITAGFTNSNDAVLPTSPIVISLPAGLSAGSYTGSLVARNSTNNVSSTAQPFTITITAAPTAAIQYSGSPFCQTGTAAPAITGTTGGVFSSTTGLSLNGITGVIDLAASTPGTYTVTYTYGTAPCTRATTTSVTVNSNVIVAATTGNNQMCTGTATTLNNATPGGVWSSSHTSIATVNSSGVVTGLAAGAVTINYTVTGACGTATQPFQITVNTAPVVPDVTGSNNVCVGASITLANTLAGGTWSSNSPAIATVNNSGVVTGVATGAVVIRYSVANSCGATTKDFNLSVNDRPVVAAVTGLDSIFIGNNMQLQNATPGGIWSSSAPSIASISTAGMVSGLTAGTSTISYTVTNACGSATRTKVITVVAISDDVFIPNAFTPNNDGLNDAFQVYGMGIRELQLQVYNQWGERIFETKDIAGKWNGLHKGVAQPSGMYVYTARVQLANGVVLVKKGAIHLIR